MPSLLPVYTLRLPEELMQKVKRVAAANKRSINREIENMVEKAVKEFEKENGPILPRA